MRKPPTTKIHAAFLPTLALCAAVAGCATPADHWKAAVASNSKQGYVEFIQEHPQSDFDAQALAALSKYGEPSQRFVLSSFPILWRLSSSHGSTRTRVRLSQPPGMYGRLRAQGTIEQVYNPATGSLKPTTWSPGAVHTLIGNLKIDEHIFLSGPKDPLVFKVTESDYVYVGGRGVVVRPQGEITVLGPKGS